MARTSKKDDNGLAGKIIGVIFLLFLVAGGYYLFTMFRPLEITQENIVGSWKLPGSPITYFTFNPDNTASSYEKFTGTGETRNETQYTYTIEESISNTTGNTIYTIVLDQVKGDAHIEMDITGLSQMQLSILWKGSEFGSMTRVGGLNK